MAGNIFRVTQTGVSTTAGYTSVFFPDLYKTPFQVSISVVVTSTAQNLSIEHSYDYPGPNSSTWTSTAATWYQSSGISALAATSASSALQTAYTYPVTAIRIQSSAGSSTGTMAMTCVQSG